MHDNINSPNGSHFDLGDLGVSQCILGSLNTLFIFSRTISDTAFISYKYASSLDNIFDLCDLGVSQSTLHGVIKYIVHFLKNHS